MTKRNGKHEESQCRSDSGDSDQESSVEIETMRQAFQPLLFAHHEDRGDRGQEDLRLTEAPLKAPQPLVSARLEGHEKCIGDRL